IAWKRPSSNSPVGERQSSDRSRRAWSVARRERSELWRSPTGEFELGRFQAMGPVLIQEVYLEPFGTDILFAAPRLLHLSVRANAIVVDDARGVSVQNAAARLRYIAQP